MGVELNIQLGRCDSVRDGSDTFVNVVVKIYKPAYFSYKKLPITKRTYRLCLTYQTFCAEMHRDVGTYVPKILLSIQNL